jgi:hypothetical protein
MRSSKSRSRGNKNRNLRPSGGNIINRVFDSSGPDGKVRGTPAQIIEKYTQLHRDAQLSGDRVGAENFAQHAEHYTRILAEAQREIDRAREEQEQFNRERQAERDREFQRERDQRAEREAQRQGERGERERDRDRDRDRDRLRTRQGEPQAEPDVAAEAEIGLPSFLTHGFAQSSTSLEESGLGPSDLDAGERSGLVETPEMRDLTLSARSPRAPRPEVSDVAGEPAAVAESREETPRPPRPRRSRSKAGPSADDGSAIEAAE